MGSLSSQRLVIFDFSEQIFTVSVNWPRVRAFHGKNTVFR